MVRLELPRLPLGCHRKGGPMGALEGRVAIVTGASGGIGKGICRLLAAEGADLVAHYHRDQVGVEIAAAAVKAAGRWFGPT